MKTQIALNDFLKEQEKPSYLCVLLRVRDNPKKVKLIRWIENRETCEHSQSVVVDSSMIDFVQPTEHHYFMGQKKYAVVEVVFKPNASIPLTDFVDLVWKERGYGRTKSIQEVLDSL